MTCLRGKSCLSISSQLHHHPAPILTSRPPEKAKLLIEALHTPCTHQGYVGIFLHIFSQICHCPLHKFGADALILVFWQDNHIGYEEDETIVSHYAGHTDDLPVLNNANAVVGIVQALFNCCFVGVGPVYGFSQVNVFFN